MTKIAVIGAGSWGTALAQVLANKDLDVALWARRAEVACAINCKHRSDYLPNAVLSCGIVASDSLETVLKDAESIVLVTPSSYVRQTAHSMKGLVCEDSPILICSKGVEDKTGLLMTQVVAEELGNPDRIAVLSGPTHAEEVIEGQPSAAVIAAQDKNCSRPFVHMFRTSNFRTYGSEDPVGVELCGAFKNVIAIAVGVSYGMGYGDNTAAMLITRGLAEMGRMVTSCGGEAITCMGLAGAGDMVVTCMSRHSRNRRFGEDYLAKGKTLDDFKKDTRMVVEGALSCRTLEVLAKRHDVELPLTDAIRQIVWGNGDLKEIAQALTARPAKPEFYDM